MRNEDVLNQLETYWLSPDYDPDDVDPDEDEEYERWESER